MSSLTASPNALANRPAPQPKTLANPAHQAKAAEPAVTGKDFGAMVAEFARAKGSTKPD